MSPLKTIFLTPHCKKKIFLSFVIPRRPPDSLVLQGAVCLMIVSSAKEVVLAPDSLVGQSVGQKDYTKTIYWIFTKLGGRMGYGPRKNLLHFGVDPDKGICPRVFFLPVICLIHQRLYC